MCICGMILLAIVAGNVIGNVAFEIGNTIQEYKEEELLKDDVARLKYENTRLKEDIEYQSNCYLQHIEKLKSQIPNSKKTKKKGDK